MNLASSDILSGVQGGSNVSSSSTSSTPSTCRAEGRRRLYRLEPARLQPFHDWLAKYERARNERLDRMDDYLKELQEKESRSGS